MEKKIDEFSFILCIIIYIIGILLQLIFSFSPELWVDEAFTLKLIERTYREIINITAIDVHPPIYYLILKFFINGIRLIFNDISVIIISKIFSIIPYIILPIILYNKLKNNYEKNIIGLFLVSIIYILSFGVEIRMYSWAMVFVVSTYIFFHEIIYNEKISDWIMFVISGILAAYTHYFAGVSIICLYILLLIWGLVKNKKILRKWIIAVITSIILYLPWLIVFIKQVIQVKEEYWIEEIVFETIVGYIDFLFNNNNYLYYSTVIISLLLIKHIIIDKNFNKKIFYLLSGLMTLIGTVIIGIVVSNMIRPVFVSRYMFPAIPCFYMGIAMAIYVLKKKYIKY